MYKPLESKFNGSWKSEFQRIGEEAWNIGALTKIITCCIRKYLLPVTQVYMLAKFLTLEIQTSIFKVSQITSSLNWTLSKKVSQNMHMHYYNYNRCWVVNFCTFLALKLQLVFLSNVQIHCILATEQRTRDDNVNLKFRFVITNYCMPLTFVMNLVAIR